MMKRVWIFYIVFWGLPLNAAEVNQGFWGEWAPASKSAGGYNYILSPSLFRAKNIESGYYTWSDYELISATKNIMFVLESSYDYVVDEGKTINGSSAEDVPSPAKTFSVYIYYEVGTASGRGAYLQQYSCTSFYYSEEGRKNLSLSFAQIKQILKEADDDFIKNKMCGIPIHDLSQFLKRDENPIVKFSPFVDPSNFIPNFTASYALFDRELPK